MTLLLACAVSVCLVVVALSSETSGARLDLRWSPRLPVSNVQGLAMVTLTAEVLGGMTEDFYCPEVEWEYTDGSRSVYESDCEPWDRATCFERRWTKRMQLGRGAHRVVVTLRKGGRLVAREAAAFEVR